MKAFLLASLFYASSFSIADAEPLEFDVPGAHVVVVGLLDQWSGDSTAMDNSLNVVSQKKVNYQLLLGPHQTLRGGPLVFQGPSDHPIVAGVEQVLKEHHFSLAMTQFFLFNVYQPISLDPIQYESFRATQAKAVSKITKVQGDPSTLQSRISTKNFFKNVLSIGAMFKLGALKADPDFAGLATDVSRLPLGSLEAVVPIELPAFAADLYKFIEVRPVKFRGLLGQIIVAYKEEKSSEIENAALIPAIVSIAGADTTPEEIVKARERSYRQRLAAWNHCVDSGECKTGRESSADHRYGDQ